MRLATTTLFIGSSVLSVAAPSSASGGHPPHHDVVLRTSSTSETAGATFVEEDPITCADGSAGTLRTWLWVSATHSVIVNSTVNGGAPQIQRDVNASVSILDSCTGAETFLHGTASVTRDELEQRGVESATMTTTIELFEGNGDVPVGDLDVALTLTGVGATTRQATLGASHSGGQTRYIDGGWASRNAVASGSVNLDGREFADSVDLASLGTRRERVTVVEGTSAPLPELPITPGPGRIVSDVTTRIETADARFLQTEPIVCSDGSAGAVDTRTTIQVKPTIRIENRVRTTTGDIQGVVQRTNSCTGEATVAFATAPIAGFRKRDLRSAALTTTLELVTTDGVPFGTLEANLDWTGTGPIEHYVNLDETSDGSRTVRDRNEVRFRNAQVTGSVTLDGAPISQSVEYGALVDEQARQITTVRR